MKYSIFDLETGRLKMSASVPDDYVITDKDCFIAIGNYRADRHYIDIHTQAVEDAGEAPSAFHYLSGMNGWVLDEKSAQSATRAHRASLLTECDWVEFPSAKYRMGEQQIQEWLDYRQALRDVPSQEGFPVTVAWPVKP
ncbi:MAG: tail fiber assembly protein [Bacteroidales bacterium]